ncbi:unnamed protein product [Effrenium voratum]|nr:unnamed protein product [Effrenium voratum]
MLRHGDADILALLDSSVPPADLSKVSIFGSALSKFQHKSAMDWKYLNDRFVKGKAKVEAMLSERHQLVNHPSIVLGHSSIVQLQGSMGAMAVDEAVSLCQAVSSGNPNTLAFFLLPQWHSSTSKTTVLKNRRLLEDKVVGCLDVFEVAMNFAESSHAGLAAMCGSHKTSAFGKSKVLLGSLSGIERSRVCELHNPDGDKPLAPHFRVQQRGVSACKEIITQLLDGVEKVSRQPLLVVDVIPNRFAEWSSACWELQKDTLLGSGTEALDLHFLGIYHEDDHSWKVTAQDTLVGRCLAQFWDVSEEAGPKARPDSLFNEQPPALDVLTITDDAVKIPDLVHQKFLATHEQPLKKAIAQLEEEQDVSAAIVSFNSNSAKPSANPSPTKGARNSAGQTPRTAATPDWVDAAAHVSRAPEVEAAVTSTGSAQSSPEYLAWVVRSDKHFVSLVTGQGDVANKEVMTMADVMCYITRERGVTQARLLDHDMEPLTKALGGTKEETPTGAKEPVSYRYVVKPKPRINAYKPKELEGKSTARASQMGAIFHGKYTQVKIGEEVPAIVSPLKPKFYLLCAVELKPSSAIKLG